MNNWSGFGGYNVSNVYPNMGSGVNQTMETNPEPEEQEAYAQIADAGTQAIDRGKKLNIGLVILAVFLLIAIFGK